MCIAPKKVYRNLSKEKERREGKERKRGGEGKEDEKGEEEEEGKKRKKERIETHRGQRMERTTRNRYDFNPQAKGRYPRRSGERK